MTENKFLIRTVALKLLEKVYLETNSRLKATINAFELANDNIDNDTIQKAGEYLKNKHYIKTDQYASDNWTVLLLADGIDWLEDSYNINTVL